MKKENPSFAKYKLLAVLALSALFPSCDRQVSRSQIESAVKPNQSETPIQTLKPNAAKEQISQVVRTVFQDSKGQIWFGTQGGALKLSNGSLTRVDDIISENGKGVTIKDIAEDKEGRIWIAHTDGISKVEGGVVSNYYESDGLISNDVWCIETDKNNQVWIGTTEGVCNYDGNNFVSFELPEGIVDTTVGISSSKMIHGIMEDSDGRMWFSTNSGIYIKDKNSLVNISEKDGLQTPFVNEVIETEVGDCLISTSKGLY